MQVSCLLHLFIYFGHNIKEDPHDECPKPLVVMVGATGFEPAIS